MTDKEKLEEIKEAAIVFLCHLEDVLDDKSWNDISNVFWNRLSGLARGVDRDV